MLPYPKEFEGVIIASDSATKTIQPAVWLTVKEAKRIVDVIKCLEADVEGIDETSRSLIRSRCARHHLEERIKKAIYQKKIA